MTEERAKYRAKADKAEQPSPSPAVLQGETMSGSVSIRSPDGRDIVTMMLTPDKDGQRTAREVLDFLASEQQVRTASGPARS